MDLVATTLPSLGLSATSLAIAVIVFAILALIALLLPEKRSLDRRMRDLTGGGDKKGLSGQFDMSTIKLGLGWFYNHLRLEAAQKIAADWAAVHSADSEKQHKLFMQAGLRHPRMPIYFAVGQAIGGVGLGGGVAFLLQANSAFDANLALSVSVVLFAGLLGLYLPSTVLKRMIRRRKEAFDLFWDDAIGLLIICLDAGLSIEVAMRRIAHELAVPCPVLAEEFIITVADLSLLKERRLAYLNLSERMDLPSVKSVTIALIQTEKQGASIASSLRTIAQTNRQARISRAEERAASLGPKMTVPMIVFFLPVVFVIIIAPVVLTANL